VIEGGSSKYPWECRNAIENNRSFLVNEPYNAVAPAKDTAHWHLHRFSHASRNSIKPR